MRFNLVSVDQKIKKVVDIPDEIIVDKKKDPLKHIVKNKRKPSSSTNKKKKQKSRPLHQHGHNYNKQRRASK